MRTTLLLLALVLCALPARAQTGTTTGTPAASFVQSDGTLDLTAAPAGALDLAGLRVTMGDGGSLHAFAEGDYTALGDGPAGPPIDNAVYSVAIGLDGTVYIGGDFVRAGGVTLNRVARRVGGAWQPLGNGSTSSVYALAVAPDGSLYAAGSFTTGPVARWDGTAWQPLGPGLNSTVLALAVGLDGSVYAGGRFTTAGGAVGNYVARWDGTAWHPLGSGMNNWVVALAVAPDGSVYAGGQFTTAGGAPASRIARWTGTAWQPLGAGVDGKVFAVAAGSDGSVYVGGSFTTAGGAAASRIARWTGAAWQPLGSGMDDEVHALAIGPDGSLYAGGFFKEAGGVSAKRIARWTGSAWEPLGTGVNGQVEALAVVPGGGVYAGGSFATVGKLASQRVSLWDGTAWQSLGGAVSLTVNALAVAPDGSLYAGGDFTTAGGVVASYVARRVGGVWQALGGGVDAPVNALAIASDGSVYAGGEFAEAGGDPASRVARWTGRAWQPLGTGVNADVLSLAAAPGGGVYVGGSFTTAGGAAANRIARWTGSAWQPLGAGVNGPVYALAVAPDASLYVGGSFSTAGGAPARGIARWIGSAWQPLGAGVSSTYVPNGSVHSLDFAPDASLYVGGFFDRAGGAPANNVARWTGSAWQPLGSGTSSTVRAIAFTPDGSLYAGGSFITAGGAPAAHFARWTGSAWQPLGAGANGSVSALVVDAQADLVLGGIFSTAGGVAAPYIALYDAPAPPPPPPGTFTFLRPTAADIYRVGSNLKAIWDSPAPAPATVVVTLRRGGADIAEIYRGPNLSPPDFGAVRYRIPASIPPATDYTLRIESEGDPATFAVSDPFTITDRPAFVVTAPANGAPLTLGTTTTVTWTSPAGAPAGAVTIALRDKATGAVAASLTTANDGTEAFALPAGPAGSYVVTVTSDADPLYTGRSGGVRVRAVAVLSPAAGGTYDEGDALTVAWEAPTLTDPAATARVLLKRPGERAVVLAEGIANDGAFETTVPAGLAPASDYFVLVHVTSGGATYTAKSGPFTVLGTGPRAPAPALAHFALPPLAPGTREATVTVSGLPDGAEVGAYWAGRLVGAGLARGGAAVFDVRGAVVVATLVEDGRPEADDAVEVPDGAPLVLHVVAGGGETTLDAAPSFADGAEIAVDAALGAVREGAADLAVQAFPNPAAARATVRFTTVAAGPASVTVYDLLGRRVAVPFEGEAVGGVTEVFVTTSALPAGVYVVRVAAGGATATTRLTVVR